MGDREDRDWVRGLGTALIIIGAGMWGVYAIGKYLLGWQITDRDFLPYHLAVILPGMILRYHRFFFVELWKPIFRDEEKRSDQGQVKQSTGGPGVFFKALVVVNNFVHDLSTGLWVSSIVVIYLLDMKTRSLVGLLVSPALHDVMKTFFWLGIASIVVILATGSARLLYYRTESAGEDGQIKKSLLIVKHVLFTFVFIGGTYLAYIYAFS